MENQPRTGNEGNPSGAEDQEVIQQNKNIVKAYFDSDPDAFYDLLTEIGIDADYDDLTDEQRAAIVEKMRAEVNDGNDGGDGGESRDKKKRFWDSRVGQHVAKVAAATAVLGAVLASGVVGFSIAKKSEDTGDNGDGSGAKQEQEQTQELPSWVPAERTMVTDQEEGETLEKLHFTNEHKYYNDAAKAVPGQRSERAFCGQELVGAEVFKKLDPETQEKIRQGDWEAKSDLMRGTMMEAMIDDDEIAISYTYEIVAEASTDGKYFGGMFDGKSVQEIREIIHNMDEEAQDKFLQEWKDILDHMTITTVTCESHKNHNHFIEKSTVDGEETYLLKHCFTDDYGAEVSRLHFKDKDADGNWLDSDLVVRDIKANIENIEVTEGKDGEITLTYKDSLGRIVIYCMQMIIAVEGNYKIVITTDEIPTPDGEEKNPDAIIKNAGPNVDQQPAGEQTSRPEEETGYDSGTGQGSGTEKHVDTSTSGSEGQGGAEGTVDTSGTPTTDNKDQSIDDAIDDADKKHNDETHAGTSGGGSGGGGSTATPTPKPTVTPDNHQGQDDANKKADEDRDEAKSHESGPVSMDDI